MITQLINEGFTIISIEKVYWKETDWWVIRAHKPKTTIYKCGTGITLDTALQNCLKSVECHQGIYNSQEALDKENKIASLSAFIKMMGGK